MRCHAVLKSLVLAAAALFLNIQAQAQMVPGPPPPQSLDTMLLNADDVVVGKLVDYDARRGEGTFAIEQTLKGEPKQELRLSIYPYRKLAQKWKDSSSRLLVASGRRMITITDLSDDKLAVLTADLKLLRDPRKIFEEAKAQIRRRQENPKDDRSFDRPVPKKLVAGTSLESSPVYLDGPEIGAFIGLAVPIDKRLEKWARQATRSKNIDERAYALMAISYFRSDDNIALLKTLLNDPATMDRGRTRYYVIRELAFLQLQEWKIDVPRPVTEIPVPGMEMPQPTGQPKPGRPQPWSSNPLHWAAARNDLATARQLLVESPNLLNSVDDDNRNSAHYAAAHGAVECLKLLIEKGANLNQQSKVGVTPLHWAMEYGELEAFKTILRGEPNTNLTRREAANYTGYKPGVTHTPLVCSLVTSQDEYALLLIGAGADVRRADEAFRTPLHHATLAGRPARVLRALIKRGAQVNAREYDANTPLHFAVQYGTDETVRELLASGADPKLKNEAGETPIELAERLGKASAKKLMMGGKD